MHPEEASVVTSTRLFTDRFGAPPPTAMVLGSGLGTLIGQLEAPERAKAGSLGLPQPQIVGHAGEVVRGRLHGREVVVMSGRVHLYEGVSPHEVVRYVRVLHRWGVRRLLLTNAVGGISEGFDPGSLVVVTDHLNLQGASPLVGPAFGERFPDLTSAYDPGLRKILAAAAAGIGIEVRHGVLAAMLGPSYETPAEIRMLRVLGADVVGMSTVPEVLAAAGVGLRCACLSMVSNHAAGITGEPLSHAEVTEIAAEAGGRLAATLAEAVRQLPEELG
ncbi:MAG TPA: purine-nucleoside phosphorylase [Deltaproteobacteria bacterium]|nr:purine-nucleoside phosphorylase [Deltaproteobacteria bacterium]